ncbi:hypothetical protein J6590_045987 [Homalodisca vitripennis]|nr:hypothetical protein J6590_045987 [Homalodisca vitripennis]
MGLSPSSFNICIGLVRHTSRRRTTDIRHRHNRLLGISHRPLIFVLGWFDIRVTEEPLISDIGITDCSGYHIVRLYLYWVGSTYESQKNHSYPTSA